MKSKALSPEDIKQLQLEMLKEIDSICNRNGIRYSLSYGTLLGAIRHKGFIPWDDDVDLIMPLPDIEQLKSVFKSDNLGILDIDTCDYYEYQFPRIVHRGTYSRINRFNKWYGVSIDLYPVVGFTKYLHEIDSFMERGKSLQRKKLQYVEWYKRILRLTPFNIMPSGYKKAVRDLHSYVRQFPYEGSKKYFHVGGPFKYYQIFDYDVFETMTDVEFETYKFKCLSNYDDYLTHVYGDYMKLPPENQRIPYHIGNYYWE